MSEEKSGWDKIAEQEVKNAKKENIKRKVETGTNIASGVSTIVFIVALIVVAAVLMVVFGINILK